MSTDSGDISAKAALRVCVVGTGAIGGHIIEAITTGTAGSLRLIGVADLPSAEDRLRALASRHGCAFATEATALLRLEPQLLVEAASPAALRGCAVAFLRAGVDVMAMSVGALADDDFAAAVSDAARSGGAQLIVPSGAIGGLDAVQAARVGRLESVTLITSKPPAGFAGAPFFEHSPIDLAAISERTVLVEGTARDVVPLFPANVNVAAALSLAGLGPRATRVQVVADPALARNVHEIVVRGDAGEMRLRFENVPSANPRTSLLAVLSAIATLRRLTAPIRVG